MILVRRVGLYALVVWAAVTVNYALPQLAPGDPVTFLYGGEEGNLSPELLDQVRDNYGLDQSLLEQYLSFCTVADVLRDKIPWTLALVGSSVIIGALIGTLYGAWAAWHRGSKRESGSLVVVLALDSMPGSWVGMILIAVFAVQLGWFPSYGAATIDGEGFTWLGQVVVRMVMPVSTLVIATIGSVFLLALAAMVGVLDEPYIRLARAKGLPERTVAVRHALRTTILPVFTSLTLTVGGLLSGAVVVESVFGYPGLGKLTFDAVTERDYPLLQGCVPARHPT